MTLFETVKALTVFASSGHQSLKDFKTVDFEILQNIYVTERRNGNTNYSIYSDSRLYICSEHNSDRVSLSSCLDTILVHYSAADFEPDAGRSNVENSGTCPM